jgi:hypothetical protein
LRTFCGLTGALPICPVEKKASEVSKYGASSGAPERASFQLLKGVGTPRISTT